MSDSRTPEEGSTGADDDPERPPRYEQVIRWAEYINEHPPEVWGPQQNAVVNEQIESVQAIDVSAEDRKRIRAFAQAGLKPRVEATERMRTIRSETSPGSVRDTCSWRYYSNASSSETA